MRKRTASKRDVLMDPIYKSKLVTKLINNMMDLLNDLSNDYPKNISVKEN